MRKPIIAAGLLGALLATGAWAGYRNDVQVSVDVTYRSAWGAFGSARNSPDTTQYIGCYVYSNAPFTTSTAASGNCTSVETYNTSHQAPKNP